MRRMSLFMMVLVGVIAGCAGESSKCGPEGCPIDGPAAIVQPQPTQPPPSQPAAVKPTPSQPATPAASTEQKPNELLATRNARVWFHASQLNVNGGGVHRLRVCSLGLDSADVSIIDFDRTALRAFLAKNKGKDISASLVLSIRDIEKDQAGKLEVASIVSKVDWNQGDKPQSAADKGEVCASAAQFGVAPWTAADGKPAKSLRDLVFGSGGTVKTILNGSGTMVTAAEKGKAVQISLDASFLTHLADEPDCRGIVVFTRSDDARISFSSRDKAGYEPRIVLAVK